MMMQQTRVNQGGLMRCCLQSLAMFPATEQVHDGSIRNCRYCLCPMILKQGVWVWFRG